MMFYFNHRTDTDTCGASFNPDIFTSCYDNSTELLEYLKDLCDGERECDVSQEGVATVIDSCAGHEPYLTFGFSCVRKCYHGNIDPCAAELFVFTCHSFEAGIARAISCSKTRCSMVPFPAFKPQFQHNLVNLFSK